MKTRTATVAAALCLSASIFALAACAGSKTTAGAVNCTNTACPFSGKAVNTKYTSDFKGQTVGFCCPNCKAKFDAMSDADKAKKVAPAGK